jgi:hypothetical protein
VERIGGEPNNIIRVLAEFEDCQEVISDLEGKIAALKSASIRSEKDLEAVEEKLALRKQSLDKCKEVEEIQISPEELRNLKNIVLESAEANSLDAEISFRRFADDVLANYDTKLGFDKKITEMNQILLDSQN